MIYNIVLVIHVLVSFFLIAVILLQGGRGGLGEAMGGAAAQSLFGGGVNTVMTKITAVSAALFMVTCLSLAALSTAQGKSVIDQFPTTLPEAVPSQVLPPLSSHKAIPSSIPTPTVPAASMPNAEVTPTTAAPAPAHAPAVPSTQTTPPN